VLLVALTLALFLPAPSQPQERAVRRGATPEGFRGDLLRLIDVLQDIAALDKDVVRRQRLAEAALAVRRIDQEQLDRFAARGGTPDLRAVLRASIQVRTALRRRASLPPPPLEAQSVDLPSRPPIYDKCSGISHDSDFTFWALVAQQAADAVLAGAGRICDETIVILGEGGNTSLVCLPFEIALQAAKVPFELADFCGGEEDSSYIEGSYSRLQHINNDLLTLDGEVAALADALELLDAAVKANEQRLKTVQAVQKQIIKLLLTPEGRRAVNPAVLTCTGDDCPNVLACPGPECSFPLK
jgi:hypothetical protein